MKKKIAIIAGDGIGVDVTREAVKVLEAVNRRYDCQLELEHLDYGAERYLRDGTSLPAGEIDRFKREVAAIFLGALGDPRVPNMRHARDILLGLRVGLDLYINLRPVCCLTDALCPLKNKRARDINFVVFRENTEGIYCGVGGNFKRGTADEIAINEDINTRKGVERIVRAAFTYAAHHGRSRVTMADKANAITFAHDLWQRTFAWVAKDYPTITAEHQYVDALAMLMVRNPEQFQVIVTNNLFGDILSDLGAQLQGGMGMAPSANINPEGPSLFEPVHGSAPPLAGKNAANPVAAIMTVQMLLEHLQFAPAAAAVSQAVSRAVQDNQLTADAGGQLTCSQVGDFIAQQIG